MLTALDYCEITNVINLYPHVIDDAENYHRAGEVFTQKGRFIAEGYGEFNGVEEMMRYWAHSPERKANFERRPLWGHSIVNIVITEDRDGTVRCLSRCIGVYKDGGASMCTYNDVMQRTEAGWRIAERRLLPLEGPTVDA